jgi:hypothetical protein
MTRLRNITVPETICCVTCTSNVGINVHLVATCELLAFGHGIGCIIVNSCVAIFVGLKSTRVDHSSACTPSVTHVRTWLNQRSTIRRLWQRATIVTPQFKGPWYRLRETWLTPDRTKTYCNVFGWLERPFGLVIGFINNPQVVTTINS